MDTVYLDYNATTPVDPAVREAMLPYLDAEYGNPSSSHAVGRAARQAVERARRQVAALVGAETAEIVFTSGGTESSNMAILGTLFASLPAARGHLVISAIEHPATVEPARWAERIGFAVTTVGCDAQCVVSPPDVAAAIRDDTVLVSVMHANNEVGAIQPIEAIAEVCRSAGVPLHVDAAQSIGKIAVDVDTLGADLLTIAGHKFYAPKGIGALYVRGGRALQPVLRGAAQESGRRPGTENVPHIVGLGAAAEIAAAHLESEGPRLKDLRDELEQQIRTGLGAELVTHAEGSMRLPNTSGVSFQGVVGAELLERVPEIDASTGAACHSGTVKVSATLAAMGVTGEVARGAVRLSVGRFTGAEDVRTAAGRLVEVWRKMRGKR